MPDAGRESSCLSLFVSSETLDRSHWGCRETKEIATMFRLGGATESGYTKE